MEYSNKNAMDMNCMQVFPPPGDPPQNSFFMNEADNMSGNNMEIQHMGEHCAKSGYSRPCVMGSREMDSRELRNREMQNREMQHREMQNREMQHREMQHRDSQNIDLKNNCRNGYNMVMNRDCNTEFSNRGMMNNITPVPIAGRMTMDSFRPLEQSSNFTVGMSYVPLQRWERTYDLTTALKRGTIFPSLDLPFMR